MSTWRSFRTGYVQVAIILLTTTILFLLVNGIAFLLLNDEQPDHNPVVDRYGNRIYDAYPGWERSAVDSLLNQSYPKPSFIYEAYSQFREIPRQGKYVNVVKHGFRVNRPQGPWPIDSAGFNIFVFGGSTTFGYGVPDSSTIPARLQAHLGRRLQGRITRVYNFGRGYHFSFQERVVFESLLRQGHHPDLAIFIDGANDFALWKHTQGQPRFTPTLRGFFSQIGRRKALWAIDLPVMHYLRQREHNAQTTVAISEFQVPDTDWQEMIAHYQRNRRMTEAVARAFGIDILFVWQPISSYRYDYKQYHPLGNTITESSETYGELVAGIAARPNDLYMLNLAGIQEEEHQNLYVDMVHYNPYFNDRIAARIAERVQQLLATAPASPVQQAPHIPPLTTTPVQTR
ncbi:MAG TPA: SGNH/GDSL hydrolase family protein [Rhodothermales bacterium]|nr:SGNH/GDSL hydrolase family protein [Rhodothermales bacterium]